jgi:hypothetical protein
MADTSAQREQAQRSHFAEHNTKSDWAVPTGAATVALITKHRDGWFSARLAT